MVKTSRSELNVTSQNPGGGDLGATRRRGIQEMSWISPGGLRYAWVESLRSRLGGAHLCCGFTRDYAAECGAAALSVVLNSPVPEVCSRPLAPCERVSTSCNRKCDHRGYPATDAECEKNKNALGVEMSCEQLGSTTEHLRGVIDSLSVLLKARGSFRLC